MPDFERIPPEFDAVKDDDETIYWVGGPKLVPFLAQGIPFLIFGCLWFFLDSVFITGIGSIGSAFGGGMGGFLIVFFLLHLAPFWLSIINMLRLILVYRNTRYAYTNKRMMFRTGFFGIDFKAVDYDKIQNLEVNVGPLEKFYNVGSIKAFSGQFASSGEHGTRAVFDCFKAIEDPYGVFKAIKKVSVDIKTDWNYPNDLRPEENKGYKTTYKP